MKANVFTSILFLIAALCLLVCFVLYAISGHWLLAAIYMVGSSANGISAYLYFKQWLYMRQLLREINKDDE